MSPRAVISDFGGVLTSPLLESFLAVETSYGVPPGSLAKATLEIAARDGVNPLSQLELGRMTEASFLESLADALTGSLGREVKLERFGEQFVDQLQPNEPMIEFMRQLRARGYRMAICTNNIREWELMWRAKLPVDEIFDVVVDSAFVGSRKPERRIYEITLERLGVPASSALLIDDVDINCDAARALGMKAVWFRTTEQAIQETEAALSGDHGVD
jgi:epoxide hydrolase-like predicted phosphatase